jgi:hypothetical protein
VSRARNVRRKQLRRARDYPDLFLFGLAPKSWNRALRQPARDTVETPPRVGGGDPTLAGLSYRS